MSTVSLASMIAAAERGAAQAFATADRERRQHPKKTSTTPLQSVNLDNSGERELEEQKQKLNRAVAGEEASEDLAQVTRDLQIRNADMLLDMFELFNPQNQMIG